MSGTRRIIVFRASIDTSASFDSTTERNSRPLWEAIRKTRLACTTCTEMFGNGAAIGMTRRTTRVHRWRTRQVQRQACSVCTVAGGGSTILSAAVQRVVGDRRHRNDATDLVSASFAFFNQDQSRHLAGLGIVAGNALSAMHH